VAGASFDGSQLSVETGKVGGQRLESGDGGDEARAGRGQVGGQFGDA
jgi:hypothetical protein